MTIIQKVRFTEKPKTDMRSEIESAGFLLSNVTTKNNEIIDFTIEESLTTEDYIYIKTITDKYGLLYNIDDTILGLPINEKQIEDHKSV